MPIWNIQIVDFTLTQRSSFGSNLTNTVLCEFKRIESITMLVWNRDGEVSMSNWLSDKKERNVTRNIHPPGKHVCSILLRETMGPSSILKLLQ